MDFLANFSNIASAHQIATICRVSRRTAERWIYGEKKPKRVYMDLLLLHDRGRVMPQNWNTYAQFTGNRLDFGLGRAITHQELSHYIWSLHLWHHTLDLLPHIEARLDALMKVCPPAEVISLQAYKDEIARIKNRPFHLPEPEPQTYELPPKLIARVNGC